MQQHSSKLSISDTSMQDTGQQALFLHIFGLLACAAPQTTQDSINAHGICESLCVLTSQGTALACTTSTQHVSVNLILYSTTENSLKVTDISALSANPRLLTSPSHTKVTRLQFFATPNANTRFVRNGVDRPELKGKIDQISLLQRPGYMGPAPPGFVDEIQLQPTSSWPQGAVIETTLQLRVRNADFSQMSSDRKIYMVQFLSLSKLEKTPDSLQWQWIVCGHTANASTPAVEVHEGFIFFFVSQRC